jgi:hypothetical protein
MKMAHIKTITGVDSSYSHWRIGYATSGPTEPGVAPLPEPSLVGFGILGLLGVGIRQRRKGK